MKKTDLAIRYLVKRIEKVPRSSRESINRLLDLLFIFRTLKEKGDLKKLERAKGVESFVIDRNQGFSKFTVDGQTTEMLVKFAEKVKEDHLNGDNKQENSKDYLRQIWDLSKLTEESKFILEWALQASNLKAISHYFGGKIPLLHEVSVFYSPETSSAANVKWKGSQLFHMDGGGTQCVKLWLLCQNVESEHGPTVVVSASQSSRIAKKIGYKPGSRVDEDEELSQIEELQTFELTGLKGQWFATDTDRSFHYGSRTTEKSSRLVLMFHFVDNNSSYYMPIVSKHYRRQLKPLPWVARDLAEKNELFRLALRYRLD